MSCMRLGNCLCAVDPAKVICATTTLRLDYCNKLQVRLPVKTSPKLQLVQNTAAHLLTGVSQLNIYIKPVLEHLHWLANGFRTQFTLPCLGPAALSVGTHGTTTYVLLSNFYGLYTVTQKYEACQSLSVAALMCPNCLPYYHLSWWPSEKNSLEELFAEIGCWMEFCFPWQFLYTDAVVTIGCLVSLTRGKCRM